MKQRGKTSRHASGLMLALPLVFMGPSLARSADSPQPVQAAQPAGAKDPNVLTLDEAVLTALANHPNLKAARERIGAQEAVLGQQMSAYFPTVGLSSLYRTSQTSSDGGADAASDFYNSQFTFNFILYNFGKREGAVQAARDTLSATGYNYRTTVDSVILGAKQSYYLLLGTQAIVKVSDETVKNRELLVKQARGFYEVGTRAKIDVARAESNLFNAQADLIQAQNNVKLAWVTLKNALGLRELAERPLVEEAIITTIPYSLEQSRELAYANRPELKSFEAQLKAQDQNIAVARRGHLPDLTFDTFYGRRHVSNETANGKTSEHISSPTELVRQLELEYSNLRRFQDDEPGGRDVAQLSRYQSPGRGAAAAGHSRCRAGAISGSWSCKSASKRMNPPPSRPRRTWISPMAGIRSASARSSR